MMMTTTNVNPSEREAHRLEDLWAGAFGDDYVDRNADIHGPRGEFWHSIVERTRAQSVLEVGCNLGGNLAWLARDLDPRHVWGIDVNAKALASLHERLPEVNAVWSPARRLPFRDRMFDLVFTMGVLIHQPEVTLPLVMAEMTRCSTRYVLCGEYYAAETTEVSYRDQSGALFKRDYGRLFQELVPELCLLDQGYFGRDEGWDDITWWLLELDPGA
jgi:pseudaminic acid biosynthesis-associated methylase